MDVNEIIKAWNEGACDMRIEFIKMLQERYGKNLATVLESEDCKNA